VDKEGGLVFDSCDYAAISWSVSAISGIVESTVCRRRVAGIWRQDEHARNSAFCGKHTNIVPRLGVWPLWLDHIRPGSSIRDIPTVRICKNLANIIGSLGSEIFVAQVRYSSMAQITPASCLREEVENNNDNRRDTHD
jgi:hypothetical protein